MKPLNCHQKSFNKFLQAMLSCTVLLHLVYMYCYRVKKTNKRMIELLSEETNPNPGKILADFEKAALNAFNKKLLHGENLCCYFHLTRPFNQKINEIELKTFSENFPEFNLALTSFGTCSARPCIGIF